MNILTAEQQITQQMRKIDSAISGQYILQSTLGREKTRMESSWLIKTNPYGDILFRLDRTYEVIHILHEYMKMLKHQLDLIAEPQ